MKDYYELLEVNKNASDDTIKKVFRMLIKKNHPDLFEGAEKSKAEERVKLLNEAYEVLTDKKKREEYNLELQKLNADANVAIETLINENEYLKEVIKEKDKMIKEYLQEFGIDAQGIIEDDYYKKEETSETDYVQKEGYKLYEYKKKLKQILYILMMIVIGMIVLSITTGVNFFKILLEVIKNMF